VHRTVVEGTPGAVKRGTLNAVQVRQLKAERCSECMQLVPPRSEGMEQMLAADARSYCRHRRSIVWQQEGEPPMCCALAAVLPRASRGIRPPPVYIALRFKLATLTALWGRGSGTPPGSAQLFQGEPGSRPAAPGVNGGARSDDPNRMCARPRSDPGPSLSASASTV